MRVQVLASLLVLAACDETTANTPPPTPPPLPTVTASAAPPRASEAPSPPPVVLFTPERVSKTGEAMGTHVAFAAFTSPTLDAVAINRAFDAALAEIRRVETLMTTWKTDSELSRVNAAAGREPVAVDQETFAIVKESLHASAISEGKFDITFQSLHGLWKFDEDLDPHPPTDEQIKARLPLVDYHHIHLGEADGGAPTIYLDRSGVQISLGGIAKGYGVDRAAKVLREAGLTAFYAQAGGDLYAAGTKPDGSPWSAGIRDPRDTRPFDDPRGPTYFAVLPLSDHAFSTAGDYERSYVINGKRYHHIIDPKTGKPATASRSVTIYAPTALLADEIDDAVFILGPEKGLALVESLDDVGAVIVDSKNKVFVSKRLVGKLRITGAPTDAL